MEYLTKICKLPQSAETCRFLGAGTGGFTCMKKTAFKDYLNTRAKLKLMHAQGDNCPGQDPTEILDILPIPQP